MGAGDVKLMAMAGAFLGPRGALGAVLLTWIAGGVLAIVAAVWLGALRRVLANIHQMLVLGLTDVLSGAGLHFQPVAPLTGKLPYALAIACGTLAQISLARSGGWVFG